MCADDIYFPIEITRREYSGHVLLATDLATRGFSCIVGHKPGTTAAMNAATEPGLLFYKHGLIPEWAGKFAALAGMDPEAGLSTGDFAAFAAGRGGGIDDLAHSSAQFCYGLDDFEYMSKHSKPAGRVYQTGSPRVELWGESGEIFYRRQIDAIQSRYGRCVLFASSGGFRHPYYKKRHPIPAADEQAVLRAAEAFLTHAEYAARNLDCPVIVRPHPADDWQVWKRHADRTENLYVDSTGDLSAWTHAAAAVVHPGTSTAAIEAVVSGCPAISVWVNRLDWDRHTTVPRQLSYDAESEREMVELLEKAIQGRLSCLPGEGARALLNRKVLFPLEGASGRIAEVLQREVAFRGRSGLREYRRHLWSRAKASMWRSPEAGRGRKPDFKVDRISWQRIRSDVAAAQQILKRDVELRVMPLRVADTFLITRE